MSGTVHLPETSSGRNGFCWFIGRGWVGVVEGIERGEAGLSGGIPCLSSGGFGAGLGLREGAGPEVLRIGGSGIAMKVEIGFQLGQGFRGQIGEIGGEGIERGLPRGEERFFAFGLRGRPLRRGIGIIEGHFERGFAREQFGQILIKARGDGRGGGGLFVVAIQPGEVREEQAAIEADPAADGFAAIEDRLMRAFERALRQNFLCRIAREDQRGIPPARKRGIAPLADIGRLRRNPHHSTGAADMAAGGKVMQEPHLPFGREGQRATLRGPHIMGEPDIALHRDPAPAETAGGVRCHAL